MRSNLYVCDRRYIETWCQRHKPHAVAQLVVSKLVLKTFWSVKSYNLLSELRKLWYFYVPWNGIEESPTWPHWLSQKPVCELYLFHCVHILYVNWIANKFRLKYLIDYKCKIEKHSFTYVCIMLIEYFIREWEWMWTHVYA